MICEVPLSQGMFALVDGEDAEAVLQHKWHVYSDGQTTFYAVRKVGRTGGGRARVRLHTFLTGWPQVDHRNGNGLDNRRANLRPATNAENARNVGLRVDNASGFKGVTWSKRARKWQAQITIDGRRRYLGVYATPTPAAEAYDAAAREQFGEFACVNFPADGERGAR